jgi:lysyl endopeptidase
MRSLVFVLAVVTTMYSSDSFAGNDYVPTDAVPLFTVDTLDYISLIEEDTTREQVGLPPRFAVPTMTSITPATHGLWEKLPQDKMRWTYRVRCDNAITMNLGFGQFSMPQSGSMTIMDSSGSFKIRPFTDEDNKDHGELWTPVIPSNEAMIEIIVDRTDKKLVSRSIELTSINSGYRWLRDLGDRGASESCNVDVLCATGDAWWNEIPSVGVYTLNGFLTCSGAMINNTAEDQTPYFITANHCGVTSSADSSIVVYWNHQNSYCREGSASGNNGNGNFSQFTSGSTMRATRSYTDFTLTELSSNPNPAWGVTYSGWSRNSSTNGVGAGIHHPNAAEKRISIPDYSSASGEFWNVNWNIGRTAPGSSGSPLYDSNHRIVGVLCCGASYCTNDSNDYYGRSLNLSWTYLDDWLDPLGTGQQTLDTYNSTSAGSGACCIDTTSCIVLSQFNCDNGGGSYQGDDSICDDGCLQNAPGACCVGGGCVNINEVGCNTGGGVFQGAGTTCDSGICDEPSCPTDIDGNGVTDVSDLLEIVGQWGNTGSSDADIDGDGVVGVGDLLAVIDGWGSC